MTRLMASLAAASPAGKDQPPIPIDSPSKVIAVIIFVAAIVGIMKLLGLIGKR